MGWQSRSSPLLNKGSQSLIAGEETFLQKLVGFVRWFGQKPVATTRLARRLDLVQKPAESIAIKRAHRVRLDIHAAISVFRLEETSRAHVRQFQFFVMGHLEEHDVETRAAEQVDGAPDPR